jgi:hypothetical protein
MNEYEQLRQLAEALHKSRLWKTGSVEQALAVILMGRELGIGPTTALSNVIISAGKPTLGASLVGALIQKSGKYGYTVTEMTDQQVSVEFFEKLANYNGQGVRQLGTSTFTLQDAQRAGLAGSQTWRSYPRNLLLARAITNGARWYCPEVFGGAVYDPEELGAAPGVLPPPVDEAPVDVPYTPHPSSSGATRDGITIEGLLAEYSAEQIVAANGGKLPATEEELRAVAERLAGEPTPVG